MVKSILNLCTKYFLLVTIPSLIGIIIVGKPVLLLLTTPDIAQNSYIILIFSAFAGILLGLYNIFKVSIFLKKNTRLFIILWFFGAGINLIGNIIFIPKIGIVAAVITTILSYLLVTLFVIHYSKSKLSLNLEYLSIIKISFSAILMGILLHLVKLHIWQNPFFLISLGLFVYFFTLYIIKGIDKKEIDFLRGIRK